MTPEQLRAKYANKKTSFNPMEWLKSSREWIIEEILEYHSRKELVTVMTAVKDAVMMCRNENDAIQAMEDAILLTNFSSKQHQDFAEKQRESLRNVVFN